MKKIVASILVRNQIVVNSTNFEKYRPIGTLEQILPRLQEWEVDEINVMNITHSQNPLGDFQQLFSEELLSTIHTPLAYGGGITSQSSAETVIAAGCERVILSGSKWTPTESRRISINLGDQAILIHLPLIRSGRRIVLHQRTDTIQEYFQNIPEDWGGELFLKDKDMDGAVARFDFFTEITNLAKNLETPILVGGGISSIEDSRGLLELPYVRGVVIGSWLNRDELVIPRLKKSIHSPINLRPLAGYR